MCGVHPCVQTFYLLLCTSSEFPRLMECFPPTLHLVSLKVHFNFWKSCNLPLTRAFISLFSFQITHLELFLQDVAFQKLFLREDMNFPRDFSPLMFPTLTQNSVIILFGCILSFCLGCIFIAYEFEGTGVGSPLYSVGSLKGIDLKKHQVYGAFSNMCVYLACLESCWCRIDHKVVQIFPFRKILISSKFSFGVFLPQINYLCK